MRMPLLSCVLSGVSRYVVNGAIVSALSRTKPLPDVDGDYCQRAYLVRCTCTRSNLAPCETGRHRMHRRDVRVLCTFALRVLVLNVMKTAGSSLCASGSVCGPRSLCSSQPIHVCFPTVSRNVYVSGACVSYLRDSDTDSESVLMCGRDRWFSPSPT